MQTVQTLTKKTVNWLKIRVYFSDQIVYGFANVISTCQLFFCNSFLIPPWLNTRQPRPQHKRFETFLIHNRPQSFLKINIFSGVFLYSEKGTFLLCFFSKTFRHFFPFDFLFSSFLACKYVGTLCPGLKRINILK